MTRNFLLLSVAYASNIGGTGVITGSPPNLVVLNVLDRFGCFYFCVIIIVNTGSLPNFVTSIVIISRELYYEYYDDFSSAYGEGVSPLTYASWMGFCVPLMVVNTFLAWLWIVLLKKIYSRGQQTTESSDQDGKVDFFEKKNGIQLSIL